jgi:hypothetical protein
VTPQLLPGKQKILNTYLPLCLLHNTKTLDNSNTEKYSPCTLYWRELCYSVILTSSSYCTRQNGFIYNLMLPKIPSFHIFGFVFVFYQTSNLKWHHLHSVLWLLLISCTMLWLLWLRKMTEPKLHISLKTDPVLKTQS